MNVVFYNYYDPWFGGNWTIDPVDIDAWVVITGFGGRSNHDREYATCMMTTDESRLDYRDRTGGLYAPVIMPRL